MSSSLDRMNAIILAKSLYERREYLALNGEIHESLVRLASYRLFSVGELAEITNLSEYRVRKSTGPDVLIRAKSGIEPRHLDDLLRMIDNRAFAKLHTKRLVEGGATIAALSRVTGLNESSLRRWAGEESP